MINKIECQPMASAL